VNCETWLTEPAQRLGDCIGKGAFGSVYKAFNWGTGEAVAVKQIKLVDVPKSELRMIEVSENVIRDIRGCDTDALQAEIDLLKNLHVSAKRHGGYERQHDAGSENTDRLIA
jgi:serine/threonine protein kinase